MVNLRFGICILCYGLLGSAGMAQTVLRTGVFAGGGGLMSNSSFAAAGTMGQGVIGRSTGTTFAASAGFWGDGGIILDVESPAIQQTPFEFALDQNYPNPFNPLTRIELRIKNLEFLVLKVYDVLGKEVATLLNEMKEPGRYSVDFDGSGLASGIYFCRMTAGRFAETRAMILLR